MRLFKSRISPHAVVCRNDRIQTDDVVASQIPALFGTNWRIKKIPSSNVYSMKFIFTHNVHRCSQPVKIICQKIQFAYEDSFLLPSLDH